MEYKFKEYEINTTKKVKEKRIVTISDLHFEENITKYDLDDIIVKINDLLPHYIFILGDITCYKNLKNEDFKKNMFYFFQVLSSISKTFLVFGNHDYLVDSHYKNFFINTEKLLEFYDKMPIKVIHNHLIQEEDINIVGFDKSPNTYLDEMKDTTKLKEEMTNLLKKIESLQQNEKFTILLTHSHLDFLKLEKELLSFFDLILAGHTHNGLIPDNLEHLFKNKGIITHSKLFLNNVRGKIDTEKRPPIIVNGGITKISENHSPKLKRLTKTLFKGEIDCITLKG